MKYKLTDETIEHFGHTLHRIECVEAFANINTGEKGGYVENVSNLSQSGDAWVYGDAKVFGNAKVYGDAKVFGNAEVCGNADVHGDAKVFGNAKVYGDAKVFGNAWVYSNAEVFGDAKVFGNAEVFGDAKVHGNAEVFGDAEVHGNAKVCKAEDYIVFKNNWSSGRYFTWTRSNDMWKVGCFYGTGEELIKKAYNDSENSGKHYEAYVKFVEQLKNL